MINGQEIYAKKFNVSRATVRRAIDELVDKKVLFTVKGKGTFVSENNISKSRTGRKLSFSESERVKTQKLIRQNKYLKHLFYLVHLLFFHLLKPSIKAFSL